MFLFARRLKFEKFLKLCKSKSTLSSESGLAQIIERKSKSLLETTDSRLRLTACASIGNSLTCRYYSVQRPAENPEALNSKPNVEFLQKLDFIEYTLRRSQLISPKVIEKLYDELKSSDSVTPSQALLILQCCQESVCQEKASFREEFTAKILAAFQEKDVPLDIRHYNLLLQIYLETEHKFSPQDFLENLKDKNIKPDHVTYSNIIGKFCQEGDIEGSNQILSHMKEERIPVGEEVFNFLILGFSRRKDLEGACSILDVMRENNVTPSSDTYCTLLQAYAENKDAESFMQKLTEFKNDGVIFTENNYLDLIKTLAQSNVTQHILEIFSQIRSLNHRQLVYQTTKILLNQKQHQLAFEVFKMLNMPPNQNYIGFQFIKQLVEADLNLGIIIKYCDELRQNNWNKISHENALESFLREEKFDVALALMQVMGARGIPLRLHYFYPLLLNYGKELKKEKVLEVLKVILEHNLPFNFHFVYNYFLPALNCEGNLESIMGYFRIFVNNNNNNNDNKINNIGSVYNGFVAHIAMECGMVEAAEFVNRFPKGVSFYISDILVSRFLKSDEPAAMACILRQMLHASLRTRQDTSELDVERLDYSALRHFLHSIVAEFRNRDAIEARFVPLLREMETQGVRLSTGLVKTVSDRLGEDLTPEIQNSLSRLSSPSMVPWTKTRDGFLPPRYNARFDSQENSPRPLVVLFNHHLNEENLEEAEKTFNRIGELDPDFRIVTKPMVKFAELLLRNDRAADAISYLTRNSAIAKPSEDFELPPRQAYEVVGLVSQMLGSLSARGDLDTLRALQGALLEMDAVSPKFVLAPIVGHYINQGDLEEAISKFEEFANKYDVLPAKKELTLACIEKDDTDKVQKILDISSNIQGVGNSLYDLAFACIDLGQVSKAKKIFQTTKALNKRLHAYCEMNLRNSNFREVESIVEATEGIQDVNRGKLYEYLLEGKIAAEDPDAALAIWTQLQEEEEATPSDKLLLRLGTFLQSQGREVPFAVPEAPPEPPPEPLRSQHDSHRSAMTPLANALRQGDPELIKAAWNRVKHLQGEVPSDLLSRLIEAQLRHGDLEEASATAKAALTWQRVPRNRALRHLGEALARQGDVDTLRFLGNYITKETKRRTSYWSLLGEAYVSAGRTEEFLQEALEASPSSSPSPSPSSTSSEAADGIDSDNDSIINVPAKVCRHVLDNEPHLEPLLRSCAERQSGRNLGTVNTLWAIKFCQRKTEEAEELYDKYLSDRYLLHVKDVASFALRTGDREMVRELLRVVDRKPEGRDPLKMRIFAKILGGSRKAGNEDFAEIFDEYLASVDPENPLRTQMIALKERILRTNQDSDSSSSSSDDEKTK